MIRSLGAVISGCVTKAKRQYDDPFIIVTGDFNQWKVEEVLANFADMEEVPVGLTRSAHHIDRIFSNFQEHSRDVGTLPHWR